MKKIITGVLVLFLLSSIAYAETGFVKGKIEYMRVHNKQLVGWKPPLFWFTLVGVTSAGSCDVWQGNVLFVGDSNQMNSMVLTAYMAEKEITVAYNDADLITSMCKAGYITVGNPPPLL